MSGEEPDIVREGIGSGSNGPSREASQGLVSAPVARGEESEEEAEIDGRGRFPLATLHVDAQEVLLGVGTNVAEMRTEEGMGAE